MPLFKSFTTTFSTHRVNFKQNLRVISLMVLFFLIWLSTYIYNTDLNNWLLENVMTVLCLLFVIFTYKKYKFSDLSYAFIALMLCMHVYGSQCTYAENPLGFQIQEWMHWKRNHYDRAVHFSFGFLLAYPLREMLVVWLQYPKKLAYIFPIVFALSLGAVYEIIEWAVADLFFRDLGTAYLGTQGDPWDAQKDIFLGAFGATIASTLISIFQKQPNK